MPRDLMQSSSSSSQESSPIVGKDTMSTFRRRSRLQPTRSVDGSCGAGGPPPIDRRSMMQRSASARSAFGGMFQASNNNNDAANTDSKPEGTAVTRMRSLMGASGRSLSLRNLMGPSSSTPTATQQEAESRIAAARIRVRRSSSKSSDGGGTVSTAASSTPSSPSFGEPNNSKSSRRRQLPRRTGSNSSGSGDAAPRSRGGRATMERSKSCRTYRHLMIDMIAAPDAEDQAIDDLEHLTDDLERMAQILARVENPQKILAKHLSHSKKSPSQPCPNRSSHQQSVPVVEFARPKRSSSSRRSISSAA